jgi:uncharacterized protein YuzE
MEKLTLLKSIPYLLSAPSKRMWIDYDEEADVLYISFEKPQRADDSVMEDNVVYHFRDREMVGVSVMRASQTFGKAESDAEEVAP